MSLFPESCLTHLLVARWDDRKAKTARKAKAAAEAKKAAAAKIDLAERERNERIKIRIAEMTALAAVPARKVDQYLTEKKNAEENLAATKFDALRRKEIYERLISFAIFIA